MATAEAILLTYLANALWMTCLLAALTEILSRLSSRTPASHRHALWAAALVLAVILPLAAFQPSPPPIPVARTPHLSHVPAPLWIVIPVVFMIARAARLARALMAVSQIEKGRLIDYADVGAPFTAGIRRSVIVLPNWLRTWPAARRVAIAHEIAHIRRRDFLCNLIQEVLLLPLSWHPAALLIKSRIDETRELACDDVAARAPHAYARMLLDIAQFAQSRDGTPGLTIAMFDADCLEKRIHNLVDDRPRVRQPWLIGVAMACLGAVSLGAATQAARALTSTDFAGGWTGSLNGHSFFSMRLNQDGLGTIDNFEILVAADGTVENAEPRPGVAQIVNARVEGTTLHVASGEPVTTSEDDGPQRLTLDFTLTGTNRGEIHIPGSRVKSWNVERR